MGEADRGAEELIRSLYAEHGRSLLAYATRLTGDRAAAEDVVQETLLRAWKHSDDLIEGKGSVRGWLLTVARNIVTDRARARAVRPAEVAEVEDRPPVERDHSESVVNSMVVLARWTRSRRSTARSWSSCTTGAGRWPRPPRSWASRPVP